MRYKTSALAALSFLATISCRDHADQPQDRESPAYKAGKDAHKVVNEAEHAAEVARQKLRDGAKKIEQGWKDERKKP